MPTLYLGNTSRFRSPVELICLEELGEIQIHGDKKDDVLYALKYKNSDENVFLREDNKRLYMNGYLVVDDEHVNVSAIFAARMVETDKINDFKSLNKLNEEIAEVESTIEKLKREKITAVETRDDIDTELHRANGKFDRLADGEKMVTEKMGTRIKAQGIIDSFRSKLSPLTTELETLQSRFNDLKKLLINRPLPNTIQIPDSVRLKLRNLIDGHQARIQSTWGILQKHSPEKVEALEKLKTLVLNSNNIEDIRTQIGKWEKENKAVVDAPRARFSFSKITTSRRLINDMKETLGEIKSPETGEQKSDYRKTEP